MECQILIKADVPRIDTGVTETAVLYTYPVSVQIGSVCDFDYSMIEEGGVFEGVIESELSTQYIQSLDLFSVGR